MGAGRRRFFGAFFLALGIVLLLPATTSVASLAQGADIAIAPIGVIVLAVATAGGVAASIGGLRWLLGLE